MLQIRLNVGDLTTTPGKELSKNCPEWMQEEFAGYVVKVMRDQFKAAIVKQRFQSSWPPLSVRYLDWKKEHNLSLKIWEATGLLKKSIVYRKRNGYYLVGIDPYKKHNNGVPILYIAHCLEYGTSRIPARPLFRPIFNQMRKNMGRYWKDFIKKNHYENLLEGNQR